MAWYHDFCLSCDKQTADGVYCSQACRLADLERSGHSEPSSPRDMYSSQRGSWQPIFSTSSGSHFQLAPAVDFAAYKSSTASSTSKSAATTYSHQYTYSTSSTSTITSIPPKRLNSSSSRSSLSSIASAGSTRGLTDSDYSQLRDYSNSFDQVRTWKRRATSG